MASEFPVMTTKTLLVSNVLVAAIAFGAGYGLHEVLGPKPLQTTQQVQEPSVKPMRTSQDVTDPRTEPSAVHRQLDQALEQVASLQVELSEAREDIDVAESGKTLTPEQKLATFRKLMQDPEVRRAMMAESRKVVEDPEMQRARRAREEIQAKFLFDELFDQLGLADGQHDEFIQLWVDGRIAEMEARMDMRMRLSAGEISEEEQAAAQGRITTIQEQAQQKMADFLGTDFEAYDAYAETAVERANLNKMYSSGEPLDDYTKEALLHIMGEEKTAVGEPEPYYGLDMETAVAFQKDALERMQIRDAEVVERATSYLSESQHETLVDSLDAVRAQLETGIKYMEAEIERREKKEDEEEEG